MLQKIVEPEKGDENIMSKNDYYSILTNKYFIRSYFHDDTILQSKYSQFVTVDVVNFS